jgi:putative ABC transport system permease protein
VTTPSDSAPHTTAPAPPRLALRLLEHTLRGDDGDALLGDILESFADPAVTQRAATARALWFWRETAIALWVFRPRSLPRPSGDGLMRSFAADLRHATRLFWRAPAFTALCVLTLALGIGAATAIFSVVNPVLLRPLPYPHPERIATVWERDANAGRSNVGWQTFRDVADRARTLESAAAIGSWDPTLIAEGSAESERLVGQRVTWQFFDVLGTQPAIGRGLVESDDAAGAPRVVVMSHALWTRRYGGDTSIIGRTISLDGTPHEVRGVMSASFDNVLEPTVDLWRPLRYNATQEWACRTCRHLRMIARTRAGVSMETAAHEIDGLMVEIAEQNPGSYPVGGGVLVGLQQEVTRSVRPVLLAITGATILILLIVIANVTNLQLARGLRREEEFAIRTALGAGRGRLTQQLLAEGVVLAMLAGVTGVIAAQIALSALLARLPGSLPRLDAVRLDPPTLALAGGFTLLIGVIVGLVPAWRGSGSMPFNALRGSARTTATSRRRARAAFVITEVALAVMLLVGAGLLARTMIKLLQVNAGFDAGNLLTLQVQATGTAYPDNHSLLAHHDRIRQAVAAVPGVTAVGLASQLPLSGMLDQYGIHAQDKPLANPELAPSADRYLVTPDFLDAMRIPILRGRSFTAADDDSAAAPVVIMSAALATEIWGTESPIGKRLQIGGPSRAWSEVVGIAGNVRHGRLDDVITRQIYIPERQWSDVNSQMVLVARTRSDPAPLASSVRAAVRSIDPSQPIINLATMDEVISRSTAQRRFALLLFVAFGMVALLLASAGIYGVLAGRVAERTREIGLRSALGATPRDIVRMVMGEGAALTGLGVVLGLGGALLLARFLGALLYGVAPADPATLGGVAVVLSMVALVACLLPAMRALRIDPMAALRAE